MLLKKIKIASADIKALEQYYRATLGLAVRQINEGEISIAIGRSEIIFRKTVSNTNPFYHFAFNIPSNKLEEALTWTQARTDLLWLNEYNSYVADFKNWHAKSFYFYDPCGNILECIARYDLQNKVEEAFSSKHLLNVSEIGLVFPQSSFDMRAKFFLKEYHLDYFTKQPPLKYFRAIGDDEGLFICVPGNRNWFATEKLSGIFPINISFEKDGVEYKYEM